MQVLEAYSHWGSEQTMQGHRQESRGALLIALLLVATHMVVEIVGGILSGSLGLLAHSAHMLTVAVAIGLAMCAIWIAERPATITRTFGFQRAEVLAVMINALELWVLAGWIAFEAYRRLQAQVGEHAHAHEVEGGLMLGVAAIGLVVHLATAWVLHRSSIQSVNIQGVFWHIIAGMMASMALVVSGVLVLFFDWDFVDPVLSFVIAGLIVVSSVKLALRVLLESVPPQVDTFELCSTLEDFPGVTLVHDVHVWTMTPGYEVLMAHVLVEPSYPADQIGSLLDRMREVVRRDFGIRHITLRIGQSGEGCGEGCHHVVHVVARMADGRPA